MTTLESDVAYVKARVDLILDNQAQTHERLNSHSQRLRRLEIAHGLSIALLAMAVLAWDKIKLIGTFFLKLKS